LLPFLWSSGEGDRVKTLGQGEGLTENGWGKFLGWWTLSLMWLRSALHKLLFLRIQ
jgi:hypothetical protein